MADLTQSYDVACIGRGSGLGEGWPGSRCSVGHVGRCTALRKGGSRHHYSLLTRLPRLRTMPNPDYLYGLRCDAIYDDVGPDVAFASALLSARSSSAREYFQPIACGHQAERDA